MKVIVIGSSREQKLPSLVLQHTIRKHSGNRYRVIHTYDMKFPEPQKEENRSRTGFSFNRFAIPSLVGYRGLAVYLECDQIVFSDPQQIFDTPLGGATILRPPNQASVLLLDCSRLQWDVKKIVEDLDAGKYSYRALMVDTCIEPAANIKSSLPDDWNALDQYIHGQTKLLHYTNMDLQPWRRWGHPLTHLWMKELRELIALQPGVADVVREEIRLKHVVPQVAEALR